MFWRIGLSLALGLGLGFVCACGDAPSSSEQPTLSDRLVDIAFDIAVESLGIPDRAELVEGRPVDKAKPDYWVVRVRVAELNTFDRDSHKEYLVCLRYDSTTGDIRYDEEQEVMEQPDGGYGLGRHREERTRFLERNGWPADRRPAEEDPS